MNYGLVCSGTINIIAKCRKTSAEDYLIMFLMMLVDPNCQICSKTYLGLAQYCDNSSWLEAVLVF